MSQGSFNPAETDAFGVVVVQDFDGVAVEDGDNGTGELTYRERRIGLLACRLHLGQGHERLPRELPLLVLDSQLVHMAS
jgi:hypothetical protein